MQNSVAHKGSVRYKDVFFFAKLLSFNKHNCKFYFLLNTSGHLEQLMKTNTHNNMESQ